MIIFVDTREQLPYRFANVRPRRKDRAAIMVTTVPAGDYATVVDDEIHAPLSQRLTTGISIERKSLQDLYGSMRNKLGRVRFRAKLEKMKAYGYSGLVVEATWDQIIEPNAHLAHPTKLNPRSVVSALVTWTQEFNVHVFTCPGREFAEQVTYRLLENWYLKKGCKCVA